MSENADIISQFIAAWSRRDPEELVGYFTTDGTYHNMPTQPVSGQAGLRALISGFLKDWTWTEWEVKNLVSNGDLVVAERVDHIRVGEKPIDLPCCGVFEMQDGKIRVWRDYFDMGAYVAQMRA